ncbi:SIR2 family protein [Mucilaginibacter sp. CSA2-8R]|uniref:SIR2 family NAD-dependent protein deacylase n=1 Tax=Mucilaginibacter sp. CSA2-8R TaxID=3141542 RepID=UPI00315DD5F7
MDSILKLIRKEDVAIWIGAGFSMYAGFPSGAQLQTKLMDELSEDEKAQLGSAPSLRQTAGALVALQNGSRNTLNRVLRKEFDRKPEATHLHEMLSRIPHFKQIITTNYDSLIDGSYAHRAVIVRTGRDVPDIEVGLPIIYKPHGDLSNMGGIVITDDDYAKFQTIDLKDAFWSSLLNVFATKTLLFLAYGFEDENVWSWIDVVDRVVGDNRKQRFLVAPNWPELKRKKLEQRKIEYIDMNADSFLNRLDETLKLNLAADLENRTVSQDTFNQYMQLHDFNSVISNEGGEPKLSSLSRPNGLSKQKINFTISDEKIAKQINRLVNEGIGKKVSIPLQSLASLEYFVEDFKMNLGLNNISELVVMTLPNKRSCAIDLPEDDIYIENFNLEIIKISDKKIKIEAEIDTFGFIVKFDFIKNGFEVNLNLKNPKVLPSTNKGIKIFTALAMYYTGRKAIAFVDGVKYDITAEKINVEPTYFKEMLNFFQNLRVLEKAFEIRFEGSVADYSPSVLAHAEHLANIVKNGMHEVALDNPFLLKIKFYESLKQIPPGGTLVFEANKKVTGKLLGKDLDFGDSGIEITDPIISVDPESDKIWIVKSETKKYRIRYDKLTPFKDLKKIQ